MGLIKHQLKKVSDHFFLNFVLDVEFRIENSLFRNLALAEIILVEL